MTVTLNTKAYNQDASIDGNTVVYTGPNQSMTADDKLQLRRSKSRASADTLAVAKAFIKFTRSVTINGAVHTMFADATFSVPVGAAQSDVDALRDDLGDFLVSTNGADLVWKQDISQ